jgi:hypothetical protein
MANSLFQDPNDIPSDQGLIGNLLAQYAAYPPDTSAPLSPIEQQMMGMTGPNQPVSGLGPVFAPPPAPAPQPAAPAQPQASPIAVGNYQMPRVGPAAAFQLPAGDLDPETGEHVAPQAATAPAAMPNLGPPASQPGFDTFRQNLRHGGGLFGSIEAGITGKRNDPYGEAQAQQAQKLQQTYQALIAAGVPQKQATLMLTAGLDSDVSKALIPQYLGKDKTKFVQLKDGLGGDHPAFVNEDAQTINGQPIAVYNKQNAPDNSAGLGDMSLTGNDYLNSIPSKERGIVKAMVEGRQPMPSSFALAKPYWQNMIAAANNVDPSFDGTNWGARVKGMTSFKSGADAGTVRSANQVLGHISDLTDKADALHNTSYPLANWVGNNINAAMGGDASNNWVTQAHAVADELSAFMKGAGHSSDTEIQQWKESLSPNMSPQQQRGAIKTLMGIYDHALSALEDKRTGAIGPVAAEKLGPLVTPAGQAAMDKVRQWAVGSAPGATPVDRSAVEAEMKRRGLL